MRVLLLLSATLLVACASPLDWAVPDNLGRVSQRDMSLVRKRFEAGAAPTPETGGTGGMIDAALAARGGVDKRLAATTAPDAAVKFIDSRTVLVKLGFSRPMGYGMDYFEQFHVLVREWSGQWKHLTYFEEVVLQVRE